MRKACYLLGWSALVAAVEAKLPDLAAPSAVPRPSPQALRGALLVPMSSVRTNNWCHCEPKNLHVFPYAGQYLQLRLGSCKSDAFIECLSVGFHSKTFGLELLDR